MWVLSKKLCRISDFSRDDPGNGKAFWKRLQMFLNGRRRKKTPERKERRKIILRFRKVLRQDFAQVQNGSFALLPEKVTRIKESIWVLRLFTGCDILGEKVGAFCGAQ